MSARSFWVSPPEMFIALACASALLLGVGCKKKPPADERPREYVLEEVTDEQSNEKEDAGPPPPLMHCDLIETESLCYELRPPGGVDLEDGGTWRDHCAEQLGAYRPGACPTEGDVGKCPLLEGVDKHYYARGKVGYERALVVEDCEALIGKRARMLFEEL